MKFEIYSIEFIKYSLSIKKVMKLGKMIAESENCEIIFSIKVIQMFIEVGSEIVYKSLKATIEGDIRTISRLLITEVIY